VHAGCERGDAALVAAHDPLRVDGGWIAQGSYILIQPNVALEDCETKELLKSVHPRDKTARETELVGIKAQFQYYDFALQKVRGRKRSLRSSATESQPPVGSVRCTSGTRDPDAESDQPPVRLGEFTCRRGDSQIYRYYAVSVSAAGLSHPSTISLSQWRQFCRDCGFVADDLALDACTSVFKEILLTAKTSSVKIKLFVSHHDFIYGEFLKAILRMGVRHPRLFAVDLKAILHD
jgi:hypothetical protein